MTLKFRIKYYPRGYVVEIRKFRWFIFPYWTHYVSVAGIDSLPWYHETSEDAFSSLIDKLKQDLTV
jgi:hypothetical protein